MLILNAEADEERQQELLERVQQLLRADDGVIDHVNDWGRRKLAYEFDKRGEGRYVIITCKASAAAIAEVNRVLGISRDVAIRHMTIRLNQAESERAISAGAPLPVDERPEGGDRDRRGRPSRRRPR